MMQQLAIDKRISIYGNNKDIEAAERALVDNDVDLSTLDESLARLAIQSLIDEHHLKASILINGNSIWSRDRITRDIRKVVKNGMTAMTDYLYKFLSLSCGSIAHYNLNGWVSVYPTVWHLRKFFQNNEFGQRVLNHVPQRFSDVLVIVEEIESILKI
jgi:hypothetical protein